MLEHVLFRNIFDHITILIFFLSTDLFVTIFDILNIGINAIIINPNIKHSFLISYHVRVSL